MFRVTVGTQYGGEHFDQTFDAPDWQTALCAAADVVKTGCTPDEALSPDFWEVSGQVQSACDLGDDEAVVLPRLQALVDRPAPWDCACYLGCGDDSLSGKWHVHAGEPCPVHPDAPGDR